MIPAAWIILGLLGCAAAVVLVTGGLMLLAMWLLTLVDRRWLR